MRSRAAGGAEEKDLISVYDNARFTSCCDASCHMSTTPEVLSEQTGEFSRRESSCTRCPPRANCCCSQKGNCRPTYRAASCFRALAPQDNTHTRDRFPPAQCTCAYTDRSPCPPLLLMMSGVSRWKRLYKVAMTTFRILLVFSRFEPPFSPYAFDCNSSTTVHVATCVTNRAT